MSSHLALLGGAVIGMAAGAALLPLTRQQLAGAVARAELAGGTGTVETSPPRLGTGHRFALVAASGFLPGLVLYRVGWSINALPPLLLLLGLIQLAYCDFARRLLPKALVHATALAVLVSGLAIAGANNEWLRFTHAALGAVIFFVVLLGMNLLNPRWMAFGDVRLSPGVGFGLAWISPFALLEGFFIANVLAAVIGLALIALARADRTSALPFGFYLALGAGITIVAWS